MDTKESLSKTNTANRKGTVLLLVILILLTFGTKGLGAGGEDKDVGRVSNEQRLDDVSSKLDALDDERAKLLEEKENLQMLLWGEMPEEVDEDEFFDMSIIELMEVEVGPVGTLTKTAGPRYIPSAVTTITREQIWSAGAHSLNELLEIYVPNLQTSRQDWEPMALGMRGIINDRDDKWLMLVNGKVMNERSHYGALSERDLPLLADIHHIDVVRGPGSAIYGPGAIAGVVNIVTENALTFQGMEIIAKVGAIEEFGSFEYKFGRRFSKDSGAYLYFGIDKYYGSNQEDSPFVLGRSFTTQGDNYNVIKGQPVPFSVNNDGQSYNDVPRIKFHGQLTLGDLDIWARYSRGGVDQVNPMQAYDDPNAAGWRWGPEWENAAENQSPSGTGYQQFTAYAKYKQECSDTFKVDYVVSYDTFRYIRRDFSYNFNRNDEDELYARVLATWTPNEKHSFAFGSEVSYEWFNSMGGGNYNTWHIGGYRWDKERWDTTTLSAMGEWQYNVCSDLTMFLGGRVDKNTYTSELWSPRAAFVWTPNEKDAIKFNFTKSVRMQNAEESRQTRLDTGEKAPQETLENYELRWERQATENLWFAATGFVSELDLIAWDSTAVATRNVGMATIYGFEGEVNYKREKWHLNASHGFSTLEDFELQPGASTSMTSHPSGRGKDLAAWSNHITKVQAAYEISPKWKVNSSVRMYWGWTGARDYAYTSGTIDDSSFAEAYDMSVFLNIGTEYKYSDNTTLRLDGTNLLGFLDHEYNSKIITGGTNFNSYRSTAPSFIFTLIHKFK
ncbi:MAG: TonB-dependent receptor plug domain-containing protein [Planctomycetes bacterium]|nr:TonB-dependent receptor plug domain-containing protein [Planctomycetota bacterium]